MSRRLLLWVAAALLFLTPAPGLAQPYFEALPSWTSSASDHNGATALGDVDGDGLLDLVLASTTRPTRLYLNTGTGFSSSPAWAGPPGQSTNNVAIGDVNGDGRLDLVCVNNGQPATLHLNRGGTFSVAPDWSSGPAELSSGVALGDVNGDGSLDLVVGSPLGAVRLYLNRGGTFSVESDWRTQEPYRVAAVALGDIDGDGDLDLICGGPAHDGVSETPLMLFPNDGGLLSAVPTWSSARGDVVSRICLGDVNGDGRLDLVANGKYTPSRLFLNQGDTFGVAPDWTTPPSERATSVALGDVDGDGILDLVCGSSTTPNRLYLGDGTSFSTSPAWAPVLRDSVASVSLADLDDDGDLDLLVGNQGKPNRIYLNVGSRFGAAPVWTSGPETPRASSVAIGDVDADGLPDMVYGNAPGGLTLYLNHAGSWSASPDWTSDPSLDIRGVTLGDIDGDGLLDLAYTKAQDISVNGEVGVYLNKGGTFGAARDWFSSVAYDPRSVAIGDVSGDGRMDLACGNSGTNIYLYISSSGTLPKGPTWKSALSGEALGLALTDVDGDGDLDLLGTRYPKTVLHTNINRPPGWLDTAASWVTLDDWHTVSLATGDLNGDGTPDLACGNIAGSATSLFANQGGALSSSPTFVYDQPAETRGVALGDVDADGDLDLAMANNLDVPSSVYLNLGGNLTGTGWREDSIRHASAAALEDIDADGDLDLVLAGRDQPSRVYAGMLARATPANPAQPARQLAASDAWFRDVRAEKIDIYRYRVRVTAVDVESDPVWVLGEYSVQGSTEWQPIVPADGPASLGPLTSSPQGMTHEFIWDVAPLPTGKHPIVLRLRAYSTSRRVSLVQRIPTFLKNVGTIEVNRPALAAVMVSPSLPTVTVGDTTVVSITFRNSGNLPLQVTSASLPDASLQLSPAPPFTLAPAESLVSSLSYTPTVAGTVGGSILIASDDPLTPYYELPVNAVALGLVVETQALTVGDPTALGEAVTVVSLPAPGVRIERGTLYYRVRGDTEFSARDLIERGTTWVGVIPGEAIRESGVEYYLLFENSGVSATNPLGAPADSVFRLDVAAPGWITATPQPTGRGDFLAARDLPVVVGMPVGSDFLDGWLRYRLGGQAAYDSVALDFNATIRAPVGVIPGAAVGARGVEFWVEARTSTRALTWPGADPAGHPDSIRVTVTDLEEPQEHPAGRYRLLSMPVDFTSEFTGSLADLLTDQEGFGSYDPTRWRLYLYDPVQGANVEYSSADAARFLPATGRGFWLISHPAHRVDIAPARALSARTGADYPLVLHPGWNIVGDPFEFAVAWESVGRPGVVGAPVVFDPALGTIGDYADAPPSRLEPFEGYFIENPSAQPETLWVPPREAPESAPEAPQARPEGIAGADSAAWSLRLRARTAQAVDGANRLGVHPLASDARDAFDRSKPPPPPGAWVRAGFAIADGERTSNLRYDIRGPAPEGHTWEIEVTASAVGEPVTLAFLPETALPGDLALRLIDREQDTEVDLRVPGEAGDGDLPLSYRLLALGPVKPYRLTLFAGSPDFIAGGHAGVPAPSRLQLDPVAPNPFRSAARVRFGLPTRQPVRLEVFGLRGDRVATLLDGAPLEPGYHTSLWDGRTAGGAQAGSGVYYLRLQAGGTSLTRRVVLIR